MSQTITIFLASSKEMKDDREKFEQFIRRKNDILNEHDLFIKLIIWEDFIDAMSKTRLQDEYDKAIRKSDIFVMLFATKVGSYTLEEFENAFEQFRECGKPLIYTYFKTEPVSLSNVSEENFLSLKAFQKRLKTLGHFQAQYDNINDLVNQFNGQLEKLITNGLIDDIQSSKQDPVKTYLNAIAEKYATLTMIGFKRNFPMDSIYIPLTVHVDPEFRLAYRRDSIMEKLFERALKAEDLPDLPEKVAVILGEPGMGKTTMLHYLARRESIKSDGLIPILIRLADFSKKRDPLETFLLAAIANYVTNYEMQIAVQKAIENGQVLVLLDGLDEVNREEYQAVTDKIRDFIAVHENCRVIITSRKAGFQSHEVPYRLFEIDKLPFAEIETFVAKWFDIKNDLAARIKANPRLYELAMNPFLLSIICVIFEKDQSLPQRRLELYQKCATTLLNLYNERSLPKKNNFSQYDKEQVLQDIAYYFFSEGQDEFPYDHLIELMRQNKERQKLNYNDDEMLAEICENSGLLHRSDNDYLFVHRSFYEYYVARKMRGESLNLVLNHANEARWEEPIRLYGAQIQKVQEGTQFLAEVWKKDKALALRCYPDMDKVLESAIIKKLLEESGINERVTLVKSLPEKIADPVKVVETLKGLFDIETNGEVIYWGAQILEEREEIKDINGAASIIYQKLDKGARERYHRFVANDMIQIPTGEFLMGSPNKEAERSNDETQHKVKINEFLISRYQVTNRLYEEFDSKHRELREKYSHLDEQPVVFVNWYEAVTFCRWLGCRLPTEGEWEYACRAGTTTPFNISDNITTDQANYNGNYPYKPYFTGKYLGKTTLIGSYPCNKFGLFDMHGNVYEWCLDWYGEKYYNECKEQEFVFNPHGPETGTYRIMRGGSWSDNAYHCRSANRSYGSPGYRNLDVGFRLVFVP